MQRTATLFAALAMTLLAACGKPEAPAPKAEPAKQAEARSRNR